MAESIPLLLGTAAAAGGQAAAFLPPVAGIAATVAPVAATGGLFGSAGAFSLGTTLSTLASLGSAGLSVYSGLQQAGSLSQQAAYDDFNARQELLRGQQESNTIRENLLRTLAAQNAAYGAAGIDVGAGTPVDVQQDAMAQADRELDTSRANTLLRAYSRRASADVLRSDARGAVAGGYIGGVGSLLDYATRRARIG